MNILKVENLCKRFGKKSILKNISFEINEGDILAFIGPNGAGKTTTVKCLLGLQKITSGTVSINGYDIKKHFIKAIEKVGSIIESPDVYMYLSGYDNLKLQASMYKNVTEDDIIRVITLVGLENRIYDKVSKYSLGMRERLGIAIALLNSPNLLILDEPTNGLDPEGIKDLRELMKKLAASGIGILISSHNLSELESFCNRVCIMAHGEILEENSIKNIQSLNEHKYIIKTKNTKNIPQNILKECQILDNNYFEVLKEEPEIAEFVKELVLKDIPIYEIKKVTLSLEEIFINKAGGNKIA